ncbi:Heavy metal transport/detoxification superfamily protein [Forsythia ovata]|uniref:Heavy metal transport/detoxification superfamily protein n=1 Tax=Forsythia ovata TaxID=205694 RepID=A0ABD1R657_9LAMI
MFDEKSNTVIITVICCSPEKIRDKLCRRGGKIIQSIQIKEPPKPKAPEKEPQKPKDPEKPKVVVVEKPKDPEKPKVVVVEKPKDPEKPKGNAPPPAAEKPKADPPKNPAPQPVMPAPGPGHVPVGFPPVYPVNSCCGPCYEGYGGGPCYHGYGVTPPPPQPCYDGYSAYGQGYARPCHVTRCDYFSEENSAGCRIM